MTLKRLVILPSILVLAFQSIGQPIQNPGTIVASATAVLAESRQAMGIISTAAPLSATGEIQLLSTGQTSPISIDVLSPAVFRVQVGTGDSAYTFVANNGVASSQENGVVHRQKAHASFFQRCELIPVQGALADSGSVSLAQAAPNSASSNIILQFAYQLPGTSPAESFTVTKQVEIDSGTFLPVKTREVQVNEGNPAVQSQFEYAFSDYRQIGSLVIPFTIKVSIDGSLEEIITMQQIVLNTSLSATEFTVGGNY